MDDPAIEFLEREKRELGDLTDELYFINNAEISDNNVADSDSNSMFKEAGPPKVEPEKIKKWREEFKTRLDLKDKNEQDKIEDLEMTANKELHDWSIRYREQLRITVKNNREDNCRLILEQTKINETADRSDYQVQGTRIWDSICRMCNFRPAATNATAATAAVGVPQAAKEATRMRELLMSLRHQPLVR